MSRVRLSRTIGGAVPVRRRPPPNQVAARVYDRLPRSPVSPISAGNGRARRYVIHLPATSADLAGAVDLAYALVWSLGFLPEFDPGQTMVSEEDAPHLRHRVCCDRLLPDSRRCGLRSDHDGPCAVEPPG